MPAGGAENLSKELTDFHRQIILILKFAKEEQAMTHNIPDRVIKDISMSARKYGVHKVILFGSRARNTHSKRSDIDIAVSGGDFNAFYWDIRESVHTLLTFDIVHLDSGVSDNLKEEIKRDGVVIYEETR